MGAPAPDNLACLVNDRVLHVGDSFDHRLAEYQGVEALALPVSAPWMTELDAAGFAERLAPRRVLPVHDGYVKDFFRTRRYEAFRGHLEKQGIGFEGNVGPEGAVEL
jgi:L-ascorbate metabolism protein UlaG (beta-lactamase superfamily)